MALDVPQRPKATRTKGEACVQHNRDSALRCAPRRAARAAEPRDARRARHHAVRARRAARAACAHNHRGSSGGTAATGAPASRAHRQLCGADISHHTLLASFEPQRAAHGASRKLLQQPAAQPTTAPSFSSPRSGARAQEIAREQGEARPVSLDVRQRFTAASVASVVPVCVPLTTLLQCRIIAAAEASASAALASCVGQPPPPPTLFIPFSAPSGGIQGGPGTLFPPKKRAQPPTTGAAGG